MNRTILLLLLCSSLTPWSIAPRHRADSARLAALRSKYPLVAWSPLDSVTGRFDCSGKTETAFLGRAGSAVYVGVAGPGGAVGIVGFPIGNDVQGGLCTRNPTLHPERAMPGPGDGRARHAAGCEGIKVANGGCDTIHIFWDPKARRLRWWQH